MLCALAQGKNYMPALRELQAAFMADIYNGTRQSAVYLNESIFGAAERIDIYHNNTFLGLIDILASFFPVTQKIVGADFFKALAREYIKKYPQASGNRHHFGAALPAFLSDFKPAASLPYLTDIAQIEWAYFTAAVADDAPVMNFEILRSRLTDAGFVLRIHPSVSILPLRYNALEIWQEHQKEDIGALILKEEASSLLVWRDADDEILMKRVSEPLTKLLQGCNRRHSFGEVMNKAADGLADIQGLQHDFAEALNLGVFADL